VLENLEHAKNKEKPPPTAQRLCENGYVPWPAGGSQGRGIASNLSKYAPDDLF